MQNSKLQLKQRAYLYALNTIKFVDALPKDQSCKIIGSQLLRSATSIGANIIEAQAASTRKDFANFFSHALKSANETKFWLGLLRDSNKADVQLTESLLREAIELANILASSLLTLRGKKKL